MASRKKDIRNGTKLLNLFSDGILSYEQLETASRIIGRERQQYSSREQQDEAAEAKALELVTALKQCRTEEEKEAVLRDEGQPSTT